MLKATLLIAALGLAHAGVVPAGPQQYLAQGPAPTYIAAPPAPALPAGLAQQVRALPPIYRTAAPAAVAYQPAAAIPQQTVYRTAPAQVAPAQQYAYRAAAPAPAPVAPAQQYAYRAAAPAPAPVQYAAPVAAAPAPPQYAPAQYAPAPSQIQEYQRNALAAQRVVQARPQPAPATTLRRDPAGQPQQPTEEDYDPNPAYNFSFDVKDDLATNYQNRKESREGDQIKGSYSVVDSDGFIRTVTYTADPVGGFKAEVIREPTDIKVIVPTQAPRVAAPAPARHAPQQYAPQQYQQQQPAPQQYQQQAYQPQAYQQ